MNLPDLPTLFECIRRNRFLPMPPVEQVQTFLQGDFREISIGVLESLITAGGLKPDHRVLDVGSGIGRIAIPLTQYLSDKGSYQGVDIMLEPIRWCQQSIQSVYDNFKFTHLDVFNDFYNTGDTARPNTEPLPFADGSFDLIFLNSVFTHLPPHETEHYMKEVHRLLAPGGKIWCSWFLIDGTSIALAKQHPSIYTNFLDNGPGPDWYVNSSRNNNAVAYDTDYVVKLMDPLFTIDTINFGHWCKRADPFLEQDIVVATKK